MLSFQQVRAINAEAAVLRGLYRFQEAVDLIERNLPEMTPDDRAGIVPQLLYAANEGNLRDVAVRYLPELMKNDPEMPLVSVTRKKWGL